MQEQMNNLTENDVSGHGTKISPDTHTQSSKTDLSDLYPVLCARVLFPENVY